ncbi:MAG: ABC transporter ATP-binding protein [Nitrospinota bacterium]|nr:MAG: ABC transporter ATP-binding protein [Nitrospinota bacterium]
MATLQERIGSPYDVELHHVVKRYGEVTALHDLTLQVRTGEFLTLLGPSGCGKTTTLRIIGGFEAVTSGEVRIKGRVVTTDPPYRRDTSMVFQDYALFPHKTVGENIAFGLKMRGVKRRERYRRVKEMLELINLPDIMERKPDQLSGGQRQRVALARSLVLQPSVLLLDEPLGALDAEIRKQMQLELKSLQKRLNMTFIYVTHDQEEAMVMSDRIAVMRDGYLEQLGTPAEIYDQPRTKFVARFVGKCNLWEGKVLQASGRMLVLDTPLFGPVTVDIQKHPRSWRPGERVSLLLRPEDLRLGIPAATCVHRCKGRIKAVVHTGPVTRYTVLVHKEEVLVEKLRGESFALGEEVLLGWDPAQARLIREEAAEEG